jgi:UDP-N-acetylmuramoylalanine--D-glutamate ligase
MQNKIMEYLKDKKIAILGFGMEGKSTYNFIRRYSDMPLTIIDKNDIYETNREMLADDNNISYVIGNDYLKNLSEFDLVIKSPGVITKDIDTSNISFSSQLELLLKFNRENIIGITGTKGKSTTTTLIYEVLRANGIDARLLGNIGKPLLDDIETYTKDTKLVIEMAALQLEFVTFSPHIGIILNLYEDHLDHSGTIEKYHQNKLNILKYQTEKDYMIYHSDIEPLNSYIDDSYKGREYRSQLHNKDITLHTAYIYKDLVYFNQKELFDINTELHLIGEHNLRNIMIVLIVSEILELDLKTTIDTIKNFKPLEHRIELVGTYGEIIYYNDSIATIPDATISAIKALKEVDTLIFGGLDRGIDYKNFIDFLNTGIVRNLICMPTTGHKIASKIKNKDTNLYNVDTLEEAIERARKITTKGKICLLSPAAASYEYFKNFEEKGKAYKNLVKNL